MIIPYFPISHRKVGQCNQMKRIIQPRLNHLRSLNRRLTHSEYTYKREKGCFFTELCQISLLLRFYYVRYREIISRVLRIHTVVLYRKVNPWLGGPSYQYPPSSCIAHCDEAFRRNMIRVTIGIL